MSQLTHPTVTSPTATPPATPAGLADLLLALRAVMAEERRAVSRLDLALLETTTAHKRVLCDALAAACRASTAPLPTETARLVARLRVELGANAALIAAAGDAVAAALGLQRDDRYGRSARNRPQASTGSIRIVAY